MVIWRGWGILEILIAIVCSLVMEVASNALFGEGFYKSAAWTLPLALVISALFVYIVGIKLNNKPGKIVIDKETNEEFELKTTHSMFWIPMQYWSGIFIVLSVWIYLSNIGAV